MGDRVGSLKQVVELKKRISTLEIALRELSAMYSHAWDAVDGSLLMLPESIPRFEAAHRAAEAALKESE